MIKLLRKSTALFAACSLVLAASYPALSAPSQEELELGEYTITSILFDIPNPAEELGLPSDSCSLTGPDVSEDGTIFMEFGKTYNFTWHQTLPIGAKTEYGVNLDSGKGCSTLANYNNDLFLEYLPLSGGTLFGIPADNAELDITVSYQNVSLTEESGVSIQEEGRYSGGPYLWLEGKITIDIRTTVGGTFTADITDIVKENDLQLLYSTLPAAAESGVTMLDTPEEVHFRIVREGTFGWMDDIFNYQTAPAIMHSTFDGRGYYDYTISYGAGSRSNTIIDCNEHTNTNDFLCLTGYMTFRGLDWTVIPYDTSPENVVPNSESDSGISLPTALTVTAGAGAAALGGSALSSALGDTLANSAVNFAAPDGTFSTGSASELPPADLPPESRKKYLSGDDERSDPDSGAGNDPDAPISDAESSTPEEEKLTNREDDSTPVLPEADSPEVSMSLSAPGSDLLNTKGGAVDITVEINGGEGYTWHYLPAVIIPGAQKALIPAVMGQRHLATLVLNITGAVLEEKHHAVFVNLIAWARTPDGRIIKTSGSMEMKLHEKGLEAKRDKDGKLSVTLYGETTLKGYAEIRTLASNEYTCEEMPDGSTRIIPNDITLENEVTL
ncbi:MAG: hypothetical protein IJZ85_05820 [Lachnospiraceae bacterium]|nr:hypothetical protein [Lachnospiraceae bacterium]